MIIIICCTKKDPITFGFREREDGFIEIRVKKASTYKFKSTQKATCAPCGLHLLLFSASSARFTICYDNL